MVEAARPDVRRGVDGARADRADVRARNKSAAGSRGDQQHHRAVRGAIAILTMLAWTIYISFFGVLVLMLLPKGDPRAARLVALGSALGGFLVALMGLAELKGGELVTVCDTAWIPMLGIRYHLAADGVSAT